MLITGPKISRSMRWNTARLLVYGFQLHHPSMGQPTPHLRLHLQSEAGVQTMPMPRQKLQNTHLCAVRSSSAPLPLTLASPTLHWLRAWRSNSSMSAAHGGRRQGGRVHSECRCCCLYDQ
ncbi:hypothetical protein BD309DRAFT_968243 [Dichomitus squalens]|nr:hypothetical protein BD309DRAFT_968243 [Dichomitus squalens]